jgi:non-ribosomal peptide synthetase component F
MPGPLLDGLEALGRREGATPFMTLLAAFQVLLHRYTGQTDFAVGSPIAGRTRSEVEGLIGFFVNTLVFRGDLAGRPSFRALLRRTRQVALDAYANQDLPFEVLVGGLSPGRAPGRSPLFRVMFALQNAPMPALALPDLEVTPFEPETGTAKFDLSLFVAEDADGLTATMEYSLDLFDATTVDRMLGHFRTLLEGLVDDPDRPVDSLRILTEREKAGLLGRSPEELPRAPDDLDSMLEELSNDGGSDRWTA